MNKSTRKSSQYCTKSNIDFFSNLMFISFLQVLQLQTNWMTGYTSNAFFITPSTSRTMFKNHVQKPCSWFCNKVDTCKILNFIISGCILCDKISRIVIFGLVFLLSSKLDWGNYCHVSLLSIV